MEYAHLNEGSNDFGQVPHLLRDLLPLSPTYSPHFRGSVELDQNHF